MTKQKTKTIPYGGKRVKFYGADPSEVNNKRPRQEAKRHIRTEFDDMADNKFLDMIAGFKGKDDEVSRWDNYDVPTLEEIIEAEIDDLWCQRALDKAA